MDALPPSCGIILRVPSLASCPLPLAAGRPRSSRDKAPPSTGETDLTENVDQVSSPTPSALTGSNCLDRRRMFPRQGQWEDDHRTDGLDRAAPSTICRPEPFHYQVPPTIPPHSLETNTPSASEMPIPRSSELCGEEVGRHLLALRRGWSPREPPMPTEGTLKPARSTWETRLPKKRKGVPSSRSQALTPLLSARDKIARGNTCDLSSVLVTLSLCSSVLIMTLRPHVTGGHAKNTAAASCNLAAGSNAIGVISMYCYLKSDPGQAHSRSNRHSIMCLNVVIVTLCPHVTSGPISAEGSDVTDLTSIAMVPSAIPVRMLRKWTTLVLWSCWLCGPALLPLVKN